MNQATDHLTNAQIENYVGQDGTAQNPDAQRLQLEAHLADCESCLGRVLDAERIRLGLLEGDRMRETPYPGCPAEETLQELAAGIGPSEMVEATTEHAAHCDYCGPVLSRYMREFSDSLEAEDTTLLAQLESSKPGWQKKFVRQYVVTDKPKQSWSLFAGFWPKLATAAVALVAVAFGSYIFFRHDDLSHAQNLVAAAYGERRTTELRLPNALYGKFNPVPVVKGPADGGDWKSAPATLVEAEAILKQKNGELNPQWLQVEGRIDLLQGSSRSIEEAVDAFEKALSRNPENLGLKVDLATAYFEKEIRADHDRPVLIKTIDLLNDVIKNSKTNDAQLKAAALFDLAMAYEKSEMLDLALSTWQQYLQLDNTSDWAAEARKHVETLQKAIPPPKAQGYATPSYFLAHSSDPDVLESLEDYQDIAMRSWLPAAIEDPASEAGKGVAQLAMLLKQRHSDPWLQDFIDQTTPADLAATKMLSMAFTYDWNDLHYQAIKESQKAVTGFTRQNNLPGILRARYQEIYGLQRSLTGEDCLERAENLAQRLNTTKYEWLKGQLALEKAACANLVSNSQLAALSTEKSMRVAEEFHYPELGLRVIGVEASMRRLRGLGAEAWKETVGGLHTYWTGRYSWERLYQFYSVMRQCAKDAHSLYAAQSLSLQGIKIVDSRVPDDASLRAMLYLRLANTLRAQNETALADAEAEKAAALLATVSDATARRYALLTQIEFAEFELRQGNAELALSAFAPVADLLQTQDDFVRLDFYTVQGAIFRQLKQFDKAVSAYQNGVQTAERSLVAPGDSAAQLDWLLATGKTYRGLTRSLLELGRDRDALSVWEQFQSRSLDRTSSSNEHRTPELLSTPNYPLPPVSQPHLIYASFQDGLQVWLAIGSQIHSQWVPVKQDDLQRRVTEFVKQCANPSLSPDKSEALYSLILQPMIADLPASGTVAIELDEPLLGLSVEALRNGAGRYFADDHSVVYSPGILAEETLRRPVPLVLKDPMLLVDASQSVEGSSLPGHVEEVTAVERTFPNTRTLGPSEITSAGVRQALARSSEFHFSGHGKPDGTGTALVIGSHLSLGAGDFSAEPLRHIQLAVLSACASGSAKKGTFDASNLVRAFLSGGVPTVIASRWDVDSKSTAHFMQNFYGHLRSGSPPSQALEYAQAEMRTLQSHPYYWAAFTLSGRVN